MKKEITTTLLHPKSREKDEKEMSQPNLQLCLPVASNDKSPAILKAENPESTPSAKVQQINKQKASWYNQPRIQTRREPVTWVITTS